MANTLRVERDPVPFASVDSLTATQRGDMDVLVAKQWRADGKNAVVEAFLCGIAGERERVERSLEQTNNRTR